MEMYAATEGRGGVLEPAGMVEIKFRKGDLLKSAHRLDPKLIEMSAKLKELKAAGAGSERDVAVLETDMAERETKLLVLYRQIAEHFADLHDTPGRMKVKGVITDVVPWKRSRSYFYWRLRRRLGEMHLRKQLQAASVVPGQPDSRMSLSESTKLMQSWFVRARESGLLRGMPAGTSGSDNELWGDDRAVLAWMKDESDNINRNIKEIRERSVRSAVVAIGREDPGSVVKGILDLIEQVLSPRFTLQTCSLHLPMVAPQHNTTQEMTRQSETTQHNTQDETTQHKTSHKIGQSRTGQGKTGQAHTQAL
jgi:acetyl-CoA carboxylase/biotin carboxylase 1